MKIIDIDQNTPEWIEFKKVKLAAQVLKILSPNAVIQSKLAFTDY
jgi:hypothetical protein